MFTTEVRNEIETDASRIGVEPAALLAIAEVEAAGRAYATVNGRKEPLIRFEGHYFDRRLPAAKRSAARDAGLADPKSGAVKNPASQAARWAMLARASAIDHKAAHESVSWGLGQVMGAHWEWLGYPGIDELVAEARSGVGGQISLMARYIDRAGLAAAIRRRDWAAFARGYNGPGYKRHGYDQDRRSLCEICRSCRGFACPRHICLATRLDGRRGQGPAVAACRGRLSYPLRRRVRPTDGRRRAGFPEGAGAGRGRHRRSADAGDAEWDRDGDPGAGHAVLALVPGLAAWSLARLMDLAAAIC